MHNSWETKSFWTKHSSRGTERRWQAECDGCNIVCESAMQHPLRIVPSRLRTHAFMAQLTSTHHHHDRYKSAYGENVANKSGSRLSINRYECTALLALHLHNLHATTSLLPWHIRSTHSLSLWKLSSHSHWHSGLLSLRFHSRCHSHSHFDSPSLPLARTNTKIHSCLDTPEIDWRRFVSSAGT